MIPKPAIARRGLILLAVLIALAAFGASAAQAGNYVVAQCSPGLYPGAPDAGFSATTTHYLPREDCSPEAPGLEIVHGLQTGETGTVEHAYGAWSWEAPTGTFITGGSVFARLATEDGQHGYLAVSPDAGAGVAFDVTNDDQGHTTGVPAGNWRWLVARLECTAPNEGNRCVGAAGGAHAYLKQVRIQLTDVTAPTLSVGGSLLSGQELRGPQSLEVSAGDEGGGLQGVEVTVNGQAAGGEDLSAACNPLPGGLTSRLVPCPSAFSHTFSLETAAAPFHDGVNQVSVCVHDYAQTGSPNSACKSAEVLTDNLCPGSPVAGGQTIAAGFAGNHRDVRTVSFRKRAEIRGRLRDGAGNPVAGAEVCVLGHTNLPGRPFHAIGTTTTNPEGGFTFKLQRGPSRTIRVGYRSGSFETVDDLSLKVRARATLHLNRHRIRPKHRVYFSGDLSGPDSAGRVVIIRGTVPGAKRLFLVSRGKTDQEGHFNATYTFAPSPPARFVFWAVVPTETGLPFARGHSVYRYIRLLP